MWDRINKAWLAIALVLAIAGAGGSYALTVEGMRLEVAANTSWRVIQTFERLSLIKKRRHLSVVEWQTWCKAGLQLGVFKTCPPR